MATADRNPPDSLWHGGGGPPDDGHAAVEPGSVLAGRFRVVRFIARGGMGAVWEAEDLVLGERIAVKTLRPEIAEDQWALGRFRREIQLGRRVTHRNVCRTFDLMQHQPAAGGPSAPITFLTMELLAGETLSERLRRAGRLSVEEALALTEQLGQGLAAAHAAGIVHGDFKSGNVMLSGEILATNSGPGTDSRGPGAGGASGTASGRVVITDFGLARGLRADPGQTTLQTSADLTGTPAYMAPEQLRGGPPSAAADIYALGVVVFEMVTGGLPFEGETPFMAALRRLHDPPRTLRSLVPELPAVWDRAVLRALARRPQDRFPDPRDLARALRGETVAGAPRGRRLLIAGIAVVALVSTLGVVAVWRREPPPGRSLGAARTAAVAAGRRAIAVLGFQNLSGREEAAWLSVALSEMLATELQAGTTLRVVPAETVARMKAELSLGDHDTLAPDTLVRILRNVGADLVVLGSYVSLGSEGGGHFRVDVRVQDAHNGETVVVLHRSGSPETLFDLVSGAGGELRAGLGIVAAPELSAGEVLAAFPVDPEVARLYAEGLSALRRFDAVSARTTLARAAELAPAQARIHSALATAWRELGYDEQARQEAQRAFDLSADLPRLERLGIEGGFRESAGEWARAEEVYRELFTAYPDALEYGLRLVQAQVSGGRPEAIGTIAELRRMGAPQASDARIELAAAQAYEAISDYPQQLTSARAAARAGEDAGAVLLVARARLSEARALRIQGDQQGAAAAAKSARVAFATAGDLGGAANALVNLGIVTWQGGDRKAALDLYREALASYQAIGNQRGSAQALNNIAIVLWQQGDLVGARHIYEQVLAVYRETHDRRGFASTLSNLGLTLDAEGDLAGARRMHEEALGVRRELGDKQGEAIALNNLALVLVEQGATSEAARFYDQVLAMFHELGSRSAEADALRGRALLAARQGQLVAARTALDRAIVLKREVGDRLGEAGVLCDLGEVSLLTGEWGLARARYQEALALRIALHDNTGTAVARTGLGRVALAENDYDRAEVLAGQALHDLDAASAVGTLADFGVEADIKLVLAQVEAERGQVREALRRLDELDSARAGRPLTWSARLSGGLLRAKLVALGGDVAAARRDVLVLRDEATRRDREADVLEVRLALARIEAVADNGDSARSMYSGIAEDARRAGFGGIAALADRLAGNL